MFHKCVGTIFGAKYHLCWGNENVLKFQSIISTIDPGKYIVAKHCRLQGSYYQGTCGRGLQSFSQPLWEGRTVNSQEGRLQCWMIFSFAILST